jgi:hypothetical protein
MKSKFMNLDENELNEMIDYAKKTGIGMNERDENGDTYLHYCVKQGFSNLVKILCKAGANIYLKNNEGKCPVDIAWENKDGKDTLGLILWHSPLASCISDLRSCK